MITICWEGHKFEYLQDQVECPECGETPQFMSKRFAPGDRERLKAISDQVKEDHKNDYDGGYKKGFMDGFEKGILAEEARVEAENIKTNIIMSGL